MGFLTCVKTAQPEGTLILSAPNLTTAGLKRVRRRERGPKVNAAALLGIRLVDAAQATQAVLPTLRMAPVTTLLISRSHSTELAIVIENSQSCGLRLTVPNAR